MPPTARPDILITAAMTAVGLAMALSILPQVLRLARRRSSQDVSVITFAIMGGGNLCWLAYGYYRGDPALVITNAVSAMLAGTTVALAMRYR